jgi:hypothetical protein
MIECYNLRYLKKEASMIRFVRMLAFGAGAVFMMVLVRKILGRKEIDHRTLIERIRANGI